MYTPKHFEEPRLETMRELMQARPLATLVTMTPQGLTANPIPLYLAADAASPFGVLQGHVARANPVWRESSLETEVLALFQGPDEYITPSWYATKRETGKVVPTWNYAVVHAQGRLRVRDDPAWLLPFLEKLTAQQEAEFAEPWRVSDAPLEYIEKLLNAIVGIEIVITRLQGKWKVSQNQPEANREGVLAGLRARDDESSAAMADLIAQSSTAG